MENSENTKKQKSFFRRIVGYIFKFILAIILIVAIFLLYCKFDSKDVIEVFPRNYSFYVHSDSAFDTLESVADVKAMDEILSSNKFKSFRQTFIDYRSSSLRENDYFKFIANRSVDAALYQNGANFDFVCTIDLGFLSGASRFADLYIDFIKDKFLDEAKYNLTFIETSSFSCFAFYTVESASSIYIAPTKNLVVISNSLECIKNCLTADHSIEYTKKEIELLNSTAGDGIRVVVNARDFSENLGGDEIISNFVNIVDKNNLSVVDLKISDSDIDVKCKLPLSFNEENPSPFENILLKSSTSPSILARTADCVQYYTFLNAGTLEELKEAIFPLVPKSQNIEETWKSAASLCKSVLGLQIEELLFSWSGSEFAALGVENQNDPVFAIQIKDEKQRQKIFEKLTDSILIKEDNSLILGGVRLSRISVPNFIRWILEKFDINLPSPYFIVHDGFIYFSESSESLSAIYTNSQNSKYIVKNANWNACSSEISNKSTVSLYYNLERSVPFFMRKNKDISNVLKLYTIGRFDVELKDKTLALNLHACARKSGDLVNVAGFPIKLDGRVDAKNFAIESGDNPNVIFWIENDSTLKLMNLKSLEIKQENLADKSYVVATSSSSKDGAILWCVTNHGTVHLYNRELEEQENYPLFLGEKIACAPTAHKNGLYVPLETGVIANVSLNGKIKYIEETQGRAINSSVSSEGDYACVYEKGFLGNILTIKNNKVENLEEPIFVPEIGFESPAMIKNSGKPYIAFVSQAGKFYLWRDNEIVENFPIELEGVFNINCRASDKYFYALSTEAILYRISLKGEILAVRIPHSKAFSPYLSVSQIDGKYNVFVCADANVIYGFNEKLELLNAFPLVGWGNPVFADIDGDKLTECISLTLDGKITAWKLR